MMYLGKDPVAIAKETGAQFVKGSFTVPSDSNANMVVQFGKTFNSYMLLIEMTDDSKAVLKNSGSTDYSTFCYVGVYPERKMDNDGSGFGALLYTYRSSTNMFSPSNMGTTAFSGSSFSMAVKDITGSATARLIKGLSYNYYIIEIK